MGLEAAHILQVEAIGPAQARVPGLEAVEHPLIDGQQFGLDVGDRLPEGGQQHLDAAGPHLVLVDALVAVEAAVGVQVERVEPVAQTVEGFEAVVDRLGDSPSLPRH